MYIFRRHTAGVSNAGKTHMRCAEIWGHIAIALVLVALSVRPSQAADFPCPSADVACLIAAIMTANMNGETNTITLEAGTYRLTEVENMTDGPNGLPSITSTLTIMGVESATTETVIDREAAVPFRIFHVAQDGTLTLEKLVLRGGDVPNDAGGGLFNRGVVTLTDSTVVGNRAQAAGGLFNHGTMTIINSTVAGNSGLERVGGLLNRGRLTLRTSTVADNAARRYGGLTNAGAMTITNSTIARNVAQGGAGGLANRSPEHALTLQNTLLANNMATESPDCSGPVTSLGHNLFGALDGCLLSPRPSDLTESPELAEFSDGGAPGHGHFPLLVDSPAIDAGAEAECPPTDQLDNPRDGDCDIGSIEFQRVPAPAMEVTSSP